MKPVRVVMASLIAALVLGIGWMGLSRGRASFLPAGLFPEARVNSPLVRAKLQSETKQKIVAVRKSTDKLSNKQTGSIAELKPKPRAAEIIRVPVRPGERLVGRNVDSSGSYVASQTETQTRQTIEAVRQPQGTEFVQSQKIRAALPIRSTEAGFVVLVASYTNLEIAQIFFQKMVANGLPAQISEGDIVRISAGPYADETSARNAAEQIAALMN